MSRQQRSLRNHIRVEKAFRLRQMRPVILLVLFSVLTSALVFGQFYSNILELFSGGDLPLYFTPEEIEALSARIPGVRETVLKWLGLLALINLSVVLLAMTVFTHRLGGPIHHIKKQLALLGQGDFSGNVRLRKGDELQDLAALLNDSIDRVEAAVSDIKEELAAIQAMDLQDCDKQKLKHRLEQLRRRVDYFKVKKPEED